MGLIADVRTALDSGSITYGRLVVLSTGNGIYHEVSDREFVNVKVLKEQHEDDSGMIWGLRNEVHFAVHSEYGVAPLLERVDFMNPVSGGNFYVSAWEWMPLHEVPLDFGILFAESAAQELAKVHKVRRYGLLESDEKAFNYNHQRAFSSHSFMKENGAVQTRLRDLYETFIAPGVNRLVTGEEQVVLHGHPEVSRFMVDERDDRMMWTGFDQVRSGLCEYDLAHMFVDLKHKYGREDLWKPFIEAYTKHVKKDFSEDDLALFVGMVLGERALYGSSRTFYHTDSDLLEEHLRSLDSMIAGSVTPLEVPELPSFGRVM